MNLDDFRYLRRGQAISSLSAKDSQLLQSIEKHGKGKDNVLLILHGFSSSPAVYRELIPKIKGYDALICPVLPGHGDSIEVFSQVKAQDWFLAAQEICERLVNEYQKVDVLGLSLGGLIACKLSESFKLNHLYLLAPALRLHLNIDLSIKIAQLAKFFGFNQLRNAAGNLCSNEAAEIAYRKLPVTTIIEMLRLAQEYQWVAPTCPIDLFLGAHDKVVDSFAVEQLFSNLPHTKIHWLKNSAHVLPLDNDIEEIIQCINTANKSKRS